MAKSELARQKVIRGKKRRGSFNQLDEPWTIPTLASLAMGCPRALVSRSLIFRVLLLRPMYPTDCGGIRNSNGDSPLEMGAALYRRVGGKSSSRSQRPIPRGNRCPLAIPHSQSRTDPCIRQTAVESGTPTAIPRLFGWWISIRSIHCLAWTPVLVSGGVNTDSSSSWFSSKWFMVRPVG
jgi:hypothetical protein